MFVFWGTLWVCSFRGLECNFIGSSFVAQDSDMTKGYEIILHHVVFVGRVYFGNFNDDILGNFNMHNTPRKINMESENDGFQKESPIQGCHFQVLC